MNRQGQVEDFVGTAAYMVIMVIFVFIVIVGFFVAISRSENQSIQNFADIRQKEAAINNLRTSLATGSYVHLLDINQQIRQSKVLGGQLITSCIDYKTEIDCSTDPVFALRQTPDFRCSWNSQLQRCQLDRITSAGPK